MAAPILTIYQGRRHGNGHPQEEEEAKLLDVCLCDPTAFRTIVLINIHRVTDAVNDDNSVIALSNNTMETLGLFRGDTVLVKGKKRKDTVLIVLADEDLDDGSARMNRVVRHNLRVKHGDIVTVHPCPDIKYVRYTDTIDGILTDTICRQNVLPCSPSLIPSKASLVPFSMFFSPHISAKLTDLSAREISSQSVVVCDR